MVRNNIVSLYKFKNKLSLECLKLFFLNILIFFKTYNLAQLVKRREYKVNTKKICLYLIQNSKIL